MKHFNNSLLNVVSPPPSAITGNNNKNNNYCLMPNLPVPSVGAGTLLPSNSIDNLSVASSAAAAANGMGSILLGSNNSTKSTSTVAAMVAAAAAAATLNNKGIQRQPSATVVSSSQLMVAHSNGVSDGGGGSAMLLGGSHHHQRLPLNPSTYQSQQSSSTHHLTTANAIAVAIAAAAATAAQQQRPYRHQHPYQTPTASAASMTSFLPLNAFRTKKPLSSKVQTNIRESLVLSVPKQSSAAMRNCTVTTIETGPDPAASSIPSILVPSSDGGTDTTVCTIAATVGATSAIATLASPVPSVMLLSTSSTSSSSYSSSHNDTIGMNNFSHRSTADDLSPSSSSSKVGGGFISSMSTMLMPMVTKTQSNEPYISSDCDLPNTSVIAQAGFVAAADRSTEIGATMNVENDSPSIIPGDAITEDGCTNNDDESSSVTTRHDTSRILLKHKLNFNDDEHDPSVTRPAKVRITEHAMIASTEIDETMVDVGASGMSEQQKDDAVRTSSLCTTNGASDGHSPQP